MATDPTEQLVNDAAQKDAATRRFSQSYADKINSKASELAGHSGVNFTTLNVLEGAPTSITASLTVAQQKQFADLQIAVVEHPEKFPALKSLLALTSTSTGIPKAVSFDVTKMGTEDPARLSAFSAVINSGATPEAAEALADKALKNVSLTGPSLLSRLTITPVDEANPRPVAAGLGATPAPTAPTDLGGLGKTPAVPSGAAPTGVAPAAAAPAAPAAAPAAARSGAAPAAGAMFGPPSSAAPVGTTPADAHNASWMHDLATNPKNLPGQIGSRGKEAKDVQTMLNALGAKPALDEDGKYGKDTAEAVINFKKAHGITPENGDLNDEASKKALIKAFQQHYNDTHHNKPTIDVDGIEGRQTEDALKTVRTENAAKSAVAGQTIGGAASTTAPASPSATPSSNQTVTGRAAGSK